MTELLAVLSISAAAGFRLALPLLIIGFVSGNLWAEVPILSQFPPSVVVGALVSWTLIELVFSKQSIVQRFIQSAEMFLSPAVGAIAGITVARTFNVDTGLMFLLGGLGGLLALVIHLVQVGWLYRLKRPSPWLIFAEDFLCVCLVLFAFDAPQQGGLIALLLLWLALRTSRGWRRWYQTQASPRDRNHPRRLKREPD
ncbi:DUF4126 domain-containing protein [Oscillatoria sp. CS-180]|uniref:DUF4126 domain-containing protein n=1 Tax=Oscillatoria sp. CS-180 TaxID=3021720 RepID=UPI00232D0B55|nr:DUF4126 domain-containing protein [Oscillatoria sp. CS-180]MDB9528293.1 DUF4126 domain-containing protein [Oscillatoria sp. CS-180]